MRRVESDVRRCAVHHNQPGCFPGDLTLSRMRDSQLTCRIMQARDSDAKILEVIIVPTEDTPQFFVFLSRLKNKGLKWCTRGVKGLFISLLPSSHGKLAGQGMHPITIDPSGRRRHCCFVPKSELRYKELRCSGRLGIVPCRANHLKVGSSHTYRPRGGRYSDDSGSASKRGAL